MSTSTLRVGYVGTPDTGRTEEFRALLQEHFEAVRVFDLARLGSLDFEGADVLVVDSDGFDIDSGSAHPWTTMTTDDVTTDALPLPTVFVGGIGSYFAAEVLGLKLGTGCQCLTELAIVDPPATSHPIFSGPAPVPAVEPTTIDSPDNFLAYSLVKDVPATVQVVEIHAPVDPDLRAEFEAAADAAEETGDEEELGRLSRLITGPGMATMSDGFLDSPDCEYILGGVSDKAHDYVAVGRHGRFLLWGFEGPPSVMRGLGKALFVNAVCYIADFAGAECEVLRIEQPRESLRIDLALTPDDELDAAATRLFLEPTPVGTTVADALAWYDHNRGYLRAFGGAYLGKFTIDGDLRELGIANDDPKLLTTLADLLDTEGPEGERARTLWQRYLRRDVQDAATERSWLAANAEHLFFSDTAGYRWTSRIDLPALRKPDTQLRKDDLIAYRVHAVRNTSGRTAARVEFLVDAGFHVYPPGSRDGIGLSFSLPENSDMRIVQPFALEAAEREPLALDEAGPEPLAPDEAERPLTFAIGRLVLEGPGDQLDLQMTFQACNVHQCLRPSTMTLSCPIEQE